MKSKKLLLTLLMALVVPWAANAQTTLPSITIETTEYVENSFVELSWNHDDITLAEGHSILYDCSYKYKTSDFTSVWYNLGSVEEKKWAFFLPVANYYYFRIRIRIVEGNNTIDTGEWAELERFSINAVAAVNGYPFTLDFEGTVPPAGFNVSGSIQDVNCFAMGTEAITGIAPLGDGSSYLCFHHDGIESHEASVVLPTFYSYSAIPLAVSFWLYSNSGSSTPNRVVLEHSSDGENWTVERTIYGVECINAWRRFVCKINLVGEGSTTPHVYVRLRFVCDETQPEQYFCLDDISVQPFENYKPYITDASSTVNSVTLSVIDNVYENGIGSERFSVGYRVSGTVNWTYKNFSMEAPYTNLVQLTVDGLLPNTEYEFYARSRIPNGMSNIVTWSEHSEIYTKSTDAYPGGPLISFADSNVKAICVANWDTDHDEELSYTEAAAVTSLNQKFHGNTSITSFDELQYFTGLTVINGTEYESDNWTKDCDFYGCDSLTSITIPNSVTSIGGYAFYGCRALTSIVIPNSVTTIKYAAFASCSSLTSITLPNTLEEIPSNMFMNCFELASVEIPNSVTRIGHQAFYGCRSLTSIEIPSSVNYIEFNANTYWMRGSLFAYCNSLEQITVDPENPVFDSRDNCNAIISKSTNTLIAGCKNTTIPNSVTAIGECAFDGCMLLTSIEIPSSVTHIYESAFEGCTRLASMTVLAETPPYVWSDAFKYVDKSIPVYVPCESAEAYWNNNWGGFSNIIRNGTCDFTVTVAVNLIDGGTVSGGGIYEAGQSCTVTATANEGYTFIDWTKDGSIVSTDATYSFTVEGNRTLVARFSNPNYITFADLNVESICLNKWDSNGDGGLSYAEAAAVTDLGEVFRYNSTISSFDELQYFTSLNSIGSTAFLSCSGLTSIAIPNSVTSIGDQAFYGCTGLTSVEIPNSVTSIGDQAFYGCTGLTSVEIGNSVTSIGWDAFYNCTGLTSVEIGNSVTSIGDHAFAYCSSLASVTIPNSVTSIERYAFYNCTSLASITVWAETPPTVGYDAFKDVNKSIPVYVPCESVETYQDWGGFTNIVGMGCSCRFVTEGNWSEASNWQDGIMPTGSDAAVIAANCYLDQEDATVHNLSFEDGKTLYVQPGYTLNATTINTTYESKNSLVIKDGGQVKSANLFYGIMEKFIKGYGAENKENSADWYLFAPPTYMRIVGELVPEGPEGYLFDQMDIYEFYEELELEWWNFKCNNPEGCEGPSIIPYGHILDIQLVARGYGYLYALQEDATLRIGDSGGNFKPTTEDCEAKDGLFLSYTPGASFAGWNLIGNPFTCDAYVKDAEGNYMAYYRMNATGDRIVLAEAGTPIKPCEGVFVQATGEEQHAYFTTTTPSRGGSMDFTVSKQSSTRDGVSASATPIDRARISFSQGKGMGHLDLMADANRLYIPQSGKDMAVVCSEPAGEMPLNFEAAENGTYTLGISLNDTELVYCHLIDNLTGADVDLLATSTGSVAEYTFEAKTTDYASRFKVVFAAKSAFEGDNASNFAFYNGSAWVVNASAEATVQVIDMMGRVVVSTDVARGVSTNGIAPGVYVMRLIDGNDVKTQKILVE